MPLSDELKLDNQVEDNSILRTWSSREILPLSILVTYRHEWQDGYGARGWKLNCALDDPNVIAATAETGCRINTSVLIHDILDHYISGFPLSGHRNEAMALTQLASRTGSDPRADYEQMVDEDLMQGRVSGESFRSFLPEHLIRLLPEDSLSGKEIIEFLKEKTGHTSLRSILADHFFELGQQGIPMARANWRRHELDYEQRKGFGICLQNLLERGEEIIARGQHVDAAGKFVVSNRQCGLYIYNPCKYAITGYVNPYN